MAQSRKSRSWNFVIQLWTMKRDSSILDLLLFLKHPLVPANTTFMASRWAFGRLQAVRANSAIDLKAKLAKLQMNQLVVKCRFGEYSFPSLRSDVREVRTQMDIAPISALWANALGYTAPSHNAERLRWTFEGSQECSQSISHWPTDMMTEIKLTSPHDFGDIQKALLPILVASLKQCPFKSVTGGCADLLVEDEDENDMDSCCGVLVNVGRGARVFKSLTTRWDALHPFLIGPYSRCAELCRLLKIPTMLEKVASAADSQSLGVVAIRGRGYHFQEYRLPDYQDPEGLTGPIQRIAWGQPEWYSQAAPLLVPLNVIGR
jgi:hypothetical protein